MRGGEELVFLAGGSHWRGNSFGSGAGSPPTFSVMVSEMGSVANLGDPQLLPVQALPSMCPAWGQGGE